MVENQRYIDAKLGLHCHPMLSSRNVAISAQNSNGFFNQ
jgi:hypothetical protein